MPIFGINHLLRNQSIMEKGMILAMLKLLYTRVENNECTGAEMKLLSDGLTEAANPLMTRKELAKYTEKSEGAIDKVIYRKLNRKFKITHVVLYPLKEILKLIK